MKRPGNELSVLVRKVSWITMGVLGFVVFVGAVVLAMDAPPGAPPKAVVAGKKSTRVMRRGRTTRYMAPKRSTYMRPKRPIAKGARPPTNVNSRAKTAVPRPELLHGKAKGITRVMRPALTGRNRPGRLSKEELQKRRDERRKRQVERLGKRIQTLSDRIQSYKQDGTRTDAQISRMERSLDRMRKRLKRMEDQDER